MKYVSTRGGVKDKSFEDALLSGFLPDGGIMMPESIPKIPPETLKNWAKLSYSELVKTIAPYFISEEEIPREDLNGIFDRAFARFSEAAIVKVAKLNKGLNILELFHGPTLAFKDLALSCVGQFLEYFLNKREKKVTIVVGTSGDTGSAAMESVRGLKWVKMIVLLPKGRCSRIQELQMTTIIEDNIKVFRVEGTSDDLDLPIRQCFMDEAFAKKHNLCSINSINWTRIMVQIAHFFYAYFQMRPECDGEAEIVIPTGACGNVTGGCVAVEMGLPVKFTCAVNSNNIVSRTLADGDFSVSDQVHQTLAPAMDIQVPYNVERLLYLVSGRDVSLVNKVQEEFEEKGKVNIPPDTLHKMKEFMKGYTVSDEAILSAMKQCWTENQYLLCPHTATAAYYHYQHSNSVAPRICVATASAVKFEEAVEKAGLVPQPTESVKALDNKPTRYVDMEKGQDWLKLLKEAIEN